MAHAKIVVKAERHIGDFEVTRNVEAYVIFDDTKRRYVFLQQVAPRASADTFLGAAGVQKGKLAAGKDALQRQSSGACQGQNDENEHCARPHLL